MFFDTSSKEMTLLMFILVFSLLIVVFILPILGRLQPKIGTINLFPQCGSNKLTLLKIMKKFILLTLVSTITSIF